MASLGAILLTFLAGTELDPVVVRKHLGSTLSIGVAGFFGPYLGVLAYAHYLLGWPWPQAQIAGIALSTTSVAVVYAVMVETGFNQTEIGKIILAGCFVNDVGTVLALGIVFANYNVWLASCSLRRRRSPCGLRRSSCPGSAKSFGWPRERAGDRSSCC